MDPFICKTLKENTWYPFGKYQEPTAENEREWRMPNQRYEEGAIDKVYQTMAENPKESLKITVNCIVGKNGSGKSSLLDILYRIINNFSHRLFDEAWIENSPEKNPQRGHHLSYAYGFEATLFFESDGVLGSIFSCYENVFLAIIVRVKMHVSNISKSRDLYPIQSWSKLHDICFIQFAPITASTHLMS